MRSPRHLLAALGLALIVIGLADRPSGGCSSGGSGPPASTRGSSRGERARSGGRAQPRRRRPDAHPAHRGRAQGHVHDLREADRLRPKLGDVPRLRRGTGVRGDLQASRRHGRDARRDGKRLRLPPGRRRRVVRMRLTVDTAPSQRGRRGVLRRRRLHARPRRRGRGRIVAM